MLRVTLANLRAHKRRLVATFAAVALGVAFLSGVLIQTSTLRTGFDRLFDAESASVNAVVRSDRTGTNEYGETIRPRIPAELVDAVRQVPGVRAAAGDVRGTAAIVGSDGDQLGGNGPPQLAMTWIDDPALSPYHLLEGRAPKAADEVVIDGRSADQGHLAVGDRTTVLAPQTVPVRVVGIAGFADGRSQSGVTAVLFSEAGARAHLTAAGAGVDRIVVDATPGTSQADLRSALAAATGDHVQVIDGESFRLENRDAVDDLMAFLGPALLSFALIALLVASFSIYNTFAILVAQRTREAALLRAIGASRRQTLRAVLVEAGLVGVVASAVGVGLGIGVASLLRVLLGSGGLDLGNPLVLAPSTLIGCVVLGTAITVLCALGPAVRASRVAPMAALRETAIDRTGATRGRLVLGGLLAAGATALLVSGTAGDGGMSAAAGGVAAAVVALAVLGPAVAGPVGRVLGAPLRLRGVTGDLARQNAVRNPRRTASSSTALMIGVAVVALFTVLGASLRASLDDVVEQSFAGDLVATAGFNGGSFDPGVAKRIGALPEVAHAAGMGNVTLRLDGRDEPASTSDLPEVAEVFDLDVRSGSLGDVTGPSLAVSSDLARRRGWEVGTAVPYALLDGTTGRATVRAVYDRSSLVGDLIAPTDLVAGHGAPVSDVVVAIGLAPGVSMDEGRAAIATATADVPTMDVQDRQEFSDAVGAQINQVLALVYGMLALSIVIALIGIANTLSLATFERTRELGLLRAIGQARGQTRAMVRWESVVIAVFGTVLGLGVGVLGAWALVASTPPNSELSVLALPGGQLAVVLTAGAVAGVLARCGRRPGPRSSIRWRPSRRPERDRAGTTAPPTMRADDRPHASARLAHGSDRHRRRRVLGHGPPHRPRRPARRRLPRSPRRGVRRRAARPGERAEASRDWWPLAMV
ncbi:MAG: FtsX-like permease family protein [Acidimicrobiales bacterium]